MLNLSPRTWLIGGLVLAGAGLVLFFSGEYRDLGLPLGWVGASVFIAATWYFVDALHRIPRSDAEARIAPGEWQAWVGLAFATALLVAALVYGAQLLAEPNAVEGVRTITTAGKNIGTLFLSWVLLMQALKHRWAGQVLADERDARIVSIARQWGRGATTFCIIGIAVVLAFSDPGRLRDFSYPFIAHMLVFALLWGLWFDQSAAAILYWRDRRATS